MCGLLICIHSFAVWSLHRAGPHTMGRVIPPTREPRSISMSLARSLGAGAASDLAPARTACSSTQLGERGAQQCGVDAVGRHAGLCVGAAGMRAAA